MGRRVGRPQPLRIAGYLDGETPPLEYVTSVRSGALRGDEALVMRNLDESRVLPGGRRERGEAIEETLRREVLEESGWTLRDIVPLGFAHLRHLGERPPGYEEYPHPDFFWLVFAAEADEFTPGMKDPDGYEVESKLLPFGDVLALDVSPVNRMYLEAAVSRRPPRKIPERVYTFLCSSSSIRLRGW